MSIVYTVFPWQNNTKEYHRLAVCNVINLAPLYLLTWNRSIFLIASEYLFGNSHY